MQRCLSRCPSEPQWRRGARTSSPSAADPWAPSEPAALALQGPGFRVQDCPCAVQRHGWLSQGSGVRL